MPTVVASILGLLQYAPAAITEITAVYTAIKGDLSATDQQTIDDALLLARQTDAEATAKADAALSTASER